MLMLTECSEEVGRRKENKAGSQPYRHADTERKREGGWKREGGRSARQQPSQRVDNTLPPSAAPSEFLPPSMQSAHL